MTGGEVGRGGEAMLVNPTLLGRDYQEVEASLNYVRYCLNKLKRPRHMCVPIHTQPGTYSGK